MSAWTRLQARAEKIVAGTLDELPPEIQAAARRVPCLLERRCADDPEILGIYGHFSPGELSGSNGPIILYLETILDYCEEEGEDFDEEVRLTFLHELGHHFGWDEGDLEERGLG
jgi:predicted Zn-dependent protease with MMP-like domain